MMKKKILAAALATIFTVASLTGCGASADENTTATGVGSEAATAATTDTDSIGDVKLTVLCGYSRTVCVFLRRGIYERASQCKDRDPGNQYQ